MGFPDVLRVRGHYQIPLGLGRSLGQEFAGVVREAGDNTSTVVGTLVFGVAQIGNGALTQLVLASEIDTCPMPDKLDDGYARGSDSSPSAA